MAMMMMMVSKYGVGVGGGGDGGALQGSSVEEGEDDTEGPEAEY